LFISLTIRIYSKFYIGSSLWLNYFYTIYLIFVSIIFFLVVSLRRVNFILTWNLLGIRSFFLVLYFLNWESIRGASNTLLVGHFGDLLLILLLWYAVFGVVSCLVPFMVWLLIGVSFTKRAQLPFSGWLPMAISAPTPISSLVHRSTLVTAGLFLLWLFGRERVG